MKIQNISYNLYSRNRQPSSINSRHSALAGVSCDMFEKKKNINFCANENAMDVDNIRVNYTKEQKLLAIYLDKVRSENRCKGLSKVSGCHDIKEKLQKEFIVKIMGKSKTGDTSNIPNACLFYGPTGCGKTFITKALAEHTLSNVVTINATEKEPEDTLAMIMDVAREAKKNYEASKKEKTMTIMVINEADFIAYKDSPVIDGLKDLMKDCAQKYKCILFLTTNYPFDLDDEILSKEVTPYKMGIPHPDRETAAEIINDKIKLVKRPAICTDKLLDELFKNEDRFYSSQQIDIVVERTLKNIASPTTEDYINTLRQHIPNPSISKKEIEKFRLEDEKLSTMRVN